MKKKLTYALLILVLLLWIVIFQRLFSGITPDGLPIPLSDDSLDQIVAPHISRPDTLILAYRDPFLKNGHTLVEDVNLDDVVIEQDKGVDQMPFVDWSVIRYFGVVSKGSKTVGLFSIHGKEFMIKRGDTALGYTLLECTQRQATISFENKVGVISLQAEDVAGFGAYSHE